MLGLVLILTVASGTITVAYVRGQIPWNADVAIVALMAQDIAHHGARPVFFNGSQYAGTLEQFYLAAVFRLFPETVTTQRVAIAVLLLAVIVFVWLITREAFGERAALVGGLYLALGPPFFFYRTLLSEGPYTPLLLIGSAILFLLLRIEARSLAGKAVTREIVLLGLLGGLGWWTHPLTLTFAACALVALVVGSGRRRLTAWSVAGLLAAVATGTFPWLLRNVHSGWASLVGPESARASAFQIREQLRLLVSEGFPIIMGARSVWASGPLFPGSVAVGYMVLALVVAFGVWVWISKGPPLQRYSAAVFLTLLFVTPALSLMSVRNDFREPRLLSPLYLAIAPLFGSIVTHPGISRWLRGSFCLAVAGLHFVALGAAPQFDPPPAQLVDGLRRRGIHAVYTSYWTAYRLTFVSGGDVVGTPFGSWNLTRRPNERRQVDESPSPAFVLDGEESGRLESYLRIRGLSYRRESIGRFAVFTGLAGAALADLRACNCIPSSPRRVTWVGIEGPHRVRSGSATRFRVRVRNDSLEAWSPQMNFSYRWFRQDGTAAVIDGLRTLVGRSPAPGETLEAQVTVEANLPAGKYILVIDVVEEGVAWFANLGVAPLKYDVEVL